MQPFDKYQGPYAIVKVGSGNDKLWSVGDREDLFYLEKNDLAGTVQSLSKALKGDQNAIKISDKIKSQLHEGKSTKRPRLRNIRKRKSGNEKIRT